ASRLASAYDPPFSESIHQTLSGGRPTGFAAFFESDNNIVPRDVPYINRLTHGSYAGQYQTSLMGTQNFLRCAEAAGFAVSSRLLSGEAGTVRRGIIAIAPRPASGASQRSAVRELDHRLLQRYTRRLEHK